MSSQVKRLENGSIEISLSLKWEDIAETYNTLESAALQEIEIPGFRKGKAPKDIAIKKLDKSKIYSQCIEKMLPQAYSEAIKEHSLHPILNPKVTITKGEENQDWEFTAITCEAPVVTLPTDYVERIKSLPKEPIDTKLSRILDYLRQNTLFPIPDILVEEEVNHRLSVLAENISSLGLTSDGYLRSKNLTPQSLRDNLSSQAKIDLSVEFILNKIREDQKLPDRPKTLAYLQSLI